jgi:energy-coupling factor transport system substrate-specific component
MATAVLRREGLWEVNSRTIVYAAIGAALYGVLGFLISIVIPGSNNVSVRPAYALVPFFGIAFGPIVGFFTGLVGNMILDQLTGYGAFTAWNWSIANGLAGLVAGLFAASMTDRMQGQGGRIIGAAFIAAAATLIGFLFVFTDIWVFGNSLESALTGSYLFVIVPNLIASVILTPVLVAAWEPLKDAIGR